MGFYTEPAFFLLLVPIVAIAAVLGLREKPMARFGCAASIVMLLLLFGRSLASLAFFVGYLAYSFVLARYVAVLFEKERPGAVARYRVALALQIAPLAVYKVGVAVEPDFLGFIGISYITFKTIQVLIETRDGLIKNMGAFEYLYFLVFFPSFTSGPILRSRKFVEDMNARRTRDEYLALLYRGAGWFILGAVYKFVGASLAEWAMWFLPSVIGTATVGTAIAANIVYALGYTFYLFFDFAGYSHMAVGLGFALGIEVPRNFRAPFLAIDIKDFWNRWHITLSTWLRDFVFMRFTSAAFAHKWFESPVTAACIGFFINFTLMGIWHGITFDYLVYGMYHGFLLASCEFIQRKWGFYKKHKRERWFRICTWAVTMVAVIFGLALFSGQVFHNPL
ncbi:MAG: D-alanyl-lipoteichoic acid biosynthesis protein DltB [Coriobacteriaceae bacterium]|nr:D-alanyl-lipoteichoic acid biosynthesis protein DltB [Coriobacteriaceae bacterium]